MNTQADIRSGLMKAAVLNQFGNEKQLVTDFIPMPKIDVNEVLIKLEYAGIGTWDVFEREGGYAEMMGVETKFPYVLGSEGSGTIVSIGEKVSGFTVGDSVIGTSFMNPKGGFYAEYVAVDSQLVMHIPSSMPGQEAGVVSGVGTTALRGLEDVLKLKQDESILVFGASGGIGHIAVQLAKGMGARVFAVASGNDGVEMVRKLGIENVVDGYREDLLAALQSFAPSGFDAALLTAGGEQANLILQAMKKDGRAVFPNGVYPEPVGEVETTGYNGEPNADIISRFKNYLETGQVKAHIGGSFALEDASSAHLALSRHYSGKICLKIR
ncbi:NADP-dependent oxidoreductase [Planococcus sp. YIM B11945]|uniref:NADP-dependent oxidoreductase n=1 Tax=Planococcus sp. YIM B11945 TaxID=3435410 RepID=UPI003D7DF8B6